VERAVTDGPGAAFTEGYVEADGFRVRYLEAGHGRPLVYLHGAGGLHLSRAHDLLAARWRVIALEAPGFGESAENTASRSIQDLARTLATAIRNLGLGRYNLWGTSFGGAVALWLAIQAPEAIDALVLLAPAAIRPDGGRPPPGSPEELRSRLYAHPERQPAGPPTPPAVLARQRALLERLSRPSREETERAIAALQVPTLVVFGTRDAMIPPETGRLYREKMPSCHYALIYDAGHEAGADRPEAFASLASDFLERHESFVVRRDSALIHP
jgi:pimeloyl-ACP methyl ester carboxylesterase